MELTALGSWIESKGGFVISERNSWLSLWVGAVLIQLDLLMMGTELLETCAGL